MKDAILGRTLSVSLRSTAPPRGGALGKEGNSRPYRSTTRRSQLISAKLYAPAKASPFRERWHGEAVTERVAFRTNPLSLAAAFRKRFLNRSRGKIGKSVCAAGTPPDFVPATSALGSPGACSPWFVAGRGESRGREGGVETPLSPSGPAERSAIIERDFPGRTPSVISLCEMPPPPKVEALAKRVSFVLISQRQEEACR